MAPSWLWLLHTTKQDVQNSRTRKHTYHHFGSTHGSTHERLVQSIKVSGTSLGDMASPTARNRPYLHNKKRCPKVRVLLLGEKTETVIQSTQVVTWCYPPHGIDHIGHLPGRGLSLGSGTFMPHGPRTLDSSLDEYCSMLGHDLWHQHFFVSTWYSAYG